MRCVCRLSLNWYLSKLSRDQAGAVGFKRKATVGEDRAASQPQSPHRPGEKRQWEGLLGTAGHPHLVIAPWLRYCS